MTKTVLSFAAVAATGAFFAGAAAAEPTFYLGGGLSFGTATSLPAPGSPLSDASTGNPVALGATVGVRGGAGNLFFGAELDADIALSGTMDFGGVTCADGFANAPYFCSQDATVRIRGILGTDLGGYELFGTLGYGVMFGQGAINPGGATDAGSVGGVTYGLGIQTDMGAGMVRAELIRDDFNNIITMPDGIYSPTWQNSSLKLSYIMSF